MATTAMIGHFSRLYASTDGVNFTELPDCRRIGAPGQPEATDVEITSLTSPGRVREFVQGLIDQGEFSFDQYWTKARFALLKGYQDNATPLVLRIVFPDNPNPSLASRAQFPGYVKAAPTNDLESEEPIMTECVCKVTGQVTFTPGS